MPSLRFLILDGISMISAQLMGQLELLINKVLRKRGGYKVRPDGTSRRFGGLNVLLFRDWWQLKPVTGTALFSDPREAASWSSCAQVLELYAVVALFRPLVQQLSRSVSARRAARRRA